MGSKKRRCGALRSEQKLNYYNIDSEHALVYIQNVLTRGYNYQTDYKKVKTLNVVQKAVNKLRFN